MPNLLPQASLGGRTDIRFHIRSQKIGKSEELQQDSYLGYPHSNYFSDDGRSMILGELNSAVARLKKVELETGQETIISEFRRSDSLDRLLWFDVAQQANRLITIAEDAAWICDLNKGGKPSLLYKPEPPALFSTSLPSISADGRRVLLGLRYPDRYAIICVTVDTGEAETLVENVWWMSHFHFCPYDEEWIGFCHEGACGVVSDRVWTWHREKAAQGIATFEQHWSKPARTLCVGHERWCFHKPAFLVIAYGVSPGGPRGLYEATLDGSPARLVSEGNRDLHCNISSSGRWAVVDTSGPSEASGRGWENANGMSDIFLIDMQSGQREWLARAQIAMHPYHPHPVFSQDEKIVYYNDAQPGGGRVMAVDNPWIS